MREIPSGMDGGADRASESTVLGRALLEVMAERQVSIGRPVSR
ncbi:hypothetical protein [Streptosporangium sp. NPDC006930]